jgi:uncharacterized protein YicC (UPF0701 family)
MDGDHMNAMSAGSGGEGHGGYEVSSHHTHPPDPSEGGAGNIDKIRDILFGNQMRDYEQRFSRLEEALRKESAELRDSTRRHLEALETFVHKELSALQGRVIAERDERSENHARLTSDLAAASASFTKRFGEMENQEAAAKSEIRSNLLQQSKELHDAIRQKAEEMTSLLERRFAELHHAKTDRAGLASLFSEVALRLSDQFKVPGAE